MCASSRAKPAALSVLGGTISCVPVATPGKTDDTPLVSHTGAPLTRSTRLRFTLDVNHEQHHRLMAHAGAARLAVDHHIGRVKANLDQRAAERSYGVADADLTPSLSWSTVSFINEMNSWKDGRAPDAPVSVDPDTGEVVRGLPWRGEVSADVFECASVNAAQALKNWTDSRNGTRAGKAGFPKFKSRHRTRPSFRVRAKYTDGKPSPVRPAGPKTIRFPKLGELKVREGTKQFRRMLEQGRFHVYAAAFTYERGRWVISITGVAAVLHHRRRDKTAHQGRVGVDLSVKTLATIADEEGTVLGVVEGVKALQHAQARLKAANQAYSRTKRGSNGPRKAAARLGKVHARVKAVREALLHELTSTIATGHFSVVIEDLNAAGMLQLRSLARQVWDASFGEFRRQLEYKCAWYGTELVIANRWFPSSKTCSACGIVKADLTLADRVYECGECGLVLDRDVNAAVNLARYQPEPDYADATTSSPPPLVAA